MKVLAIVHVYYHSMWDELERCLLNIASEDELTLALTLSSSSPELEHRIRESFPDVRIELVANRGYDIWPFLQILEQVELDDFDLLVKMHTKRDMHDSHAMKGVSTPGGVWRNNLLAFCSTQENWKSTKQLFANLATGLVTHELNCYHRKHDSCQQHYPALEELLKRIGLFLPSNGRFVAGAMFVARPNLFKVFRGYYREEDFPVPDKSHTEGLPHLLERAFGFAACAQGYKILSYNRHNILLVEFFRHCKRYFFYRQVTRNYERLRILGIPVWQKKKVIEG